jgi:hypothetical protein
LRLRKLAVLVGQAAVAATQLFVLALRRVQPRLELADRLIARPHHRGIFAGASAEGQE